ncbi:MAG: phosphotransferase [Gemmatimonadota bacterium]
MNLEACLPAELRGPSATITKIAAGLSGAGVFRVVANGQTFVLKIASAEIPVSVWRSKVQIQQLASNASVAPRVIHVDESRRAVVTAFVTDQSFPALYSNPATREAALTLLGQTLRRVHDLPLPPGAEGKDPREFLAVMWAGPLSKSTPPAFVRDAVNGILTEEAPVNDRPIVLSHNDVNPTNLAYDGEHLMLMDWDTAGPNDPLYDLAAISVFLGMDDATCQHLVAAHDDAPITALTSRFSYNRRLAAVLCGSMFLHLAQLGGHAGASGTESIESTPSLLEFYQRMRGGSLNIATAEGQWWFGLTLLKCSFGV